MLTKDVKWDVNDCKLAKGLLKVRNFAELF